MCNRRQIVSSKIFCKPQKAPSELPPIEKIRHPEYYQAKQVAPETCLACPECEKGFDPKISMQERPREMSDGSLVYIKRGWEPPSVPDGYRRKSENLHSSEAWVMLPILPECSRRWKKTTYSKCGAARITYLCNGKDVTGKECMKCGGK